ncbi:MAG: ATP-binding cassette domain-containing protein, partial [Gammaproteobacteria bacterium]
MALLEVDSLTVDFGAGAEMIRAVEHAAFTVDRGETLVLVGESGSGKSVTALSLVRLLPAAARITDGQVRFDGQDLLRLPLYRMREFRGARIG